LLAEDTDPACCVAKACVEPEAGKVELASAGPALLAKDPNWFCCVAKG
jgi:hypothetical protein